MKNHRAGRTGDTRRSTGQGGIAIKRCQTCSSPVLSAYRGAVTAVGKGMIEKVESNGDVVGRCFCGSRVVWEREWPRVRPGPRVIAG